MSIRYRFKWFAATLILFLQFSCAGFEHVISSIGDAFKGNTRKTIADFDLEEKKEYRNYYYLKHKQQREESDEIIRRMEKIDEANGCAPKNNQKTQVRETLICKPSEKRNVFQKLLKVKQP